MDGDKITHILLNTPVGTYIMDVDKAENWTTPNPLQDTHWEIVSK